MSRRFQLVRRKRWMDEEGFKKAREKCASEIATQIVSAITQPIIDDQANSHAKLNDLIELCNLALTIKCHLILSYDSFECVWHKPGTGFRKVDMIISDAAQNIIDGDAIRISLQPAVYRREKLVDAFVVKTSDVLSKAVILAGIKEMPRPVEVEK
jgi:hypothetical protein